MNYSHILAMLSVTILLSPFTLYAEDINVQNITSSPRNGKINTAVPKKTIHTLSIHQPLNTTASSGMSEKVTWEGGVTATDTKTLPVLLEKQINERENTHTITTNSEQQDCPNSNQEMEDCVVSDREERSDYRQRTGEHHEEIFHHASQIMLNRLDAGVARFIKLANRIDSRIFKIKTSGSDTAPAEGAMTSVRSRIKDTEDAIHTAEITITNASNTINTSTSTPVSNEAKKTREALDHAKESLLLVQKSLSDVIPLLMGKSEVKDNRSLATSSATPRMAD